MTPMMSLFLRCLLAAVLIVVLWSLADYSMAATPIAPVHNALQPFRPQAAQLLDLWRLFVTACAFVFVAFLVTVFLALRWPSRSRATRGGGRCTTSTARTCTTSSVLPTRCPSGSAGR